MGSMMYVVYENLNLLASSKIPKISSQEKSTKQKLIQIVPYNHGKPPLPPLHYQQPQLFTVSSSISTTTTITKKQRKSRRKTKNIPRKPTVTLPINKKLKK
jgi:hypothetical protein